MKGLLLAGILGLVLHGDVCGGTPAQGARNIPQPVASHPGNVFLAGENVAIPLPLSAVGKVNRWKALDDQNLIVASGADVAGANSTTRLNLGKLAVGWYRIELRSTTEELVDWTSVGGPCAVGCSHTAGFACVHPHGVGGILASLRCCKEGSPSVSSPSFVSFALRG